MTFRTQGIVAELVGIAAATPINCAVLGWIGAAIVALIAYSFLRLVSKGVTGDWY